MFWATAATRALIIVVDSLHLTNSQASIHKSNPSYRVEVANSNYTLLKTPLTTQDYRYDFNNVYNPRSTAAMYPVIVTLITHRDSLRCREKERKRIIMR